MSAPRQQYTPEMRDLNKKLSAVVEQFMDEREKAGASYPDAANDATAIIGEVLSAVIGALEHEGMRMAFALSFAGALGGAVEAKHEIARAATGQGSTVQ
ncbi:MULTISPECIES: hypothetical protein [unclassified Novosphingobium]|uniref:hypothetical protein n=1 Tax=unclassified Novosphingobium TaxID=2644732 RepID=UPI000D40774B|nr:MULTISPECIES: hypothetical protein [unclassified Novosphingobium]PTR07891.1 hypothetical protein C8K11_113102 [Novosphingobium sp. GV055]PUB00704.1 hypothetical protein C8K12_113102 [Novosphingobium sp. GV061]PUB16113.1 hypothetical protein C8K14_113102 [Novosphingobium sp. GV079]PUB39578.1 hypothetical protein C8K10_113102 [Novosphingobium sp. GV027]